MDRRLTLHEKLIEILGNNHVYFQPPESIKLEYPCIIYSKAKPRVNHADNRAYFRKTHYELLVIDNDPDTSIPESIEDALDYCSIDRYYISHNLTHCSLDLYY